MIVLFIVLLFGVGFYGNFLWRTDPMARYEIRRLLPGESGGMPEELGEQFDPTESHATFEVLSVGGDGKFRLKQVFPPTFLGQEMVAVVACEGGLTLQRGKGKRRQFDGESLPALIGAVDAPLFLTGLCIDNSCNEIVGVCNIYTREGGV